MKFSSILSLSLFALIAVAEAVNNPKENNGPNCGLEVSEIKCVLVDSGDDCGALDIVECRGVRRLNLVLCTRLNTRTWEDHLRERKPNYWQRDNFGKGNHKRYVNIEGRGWVLTNPHRKASCASKIPRYKC